jgi:type I phosphodiesterase/nucleotide pyrophosphatase
MADKPLASVEQVRAELRRLGYLDTGVDRFVLGDARPLSPLRASARAALRVGLLGGVVFGAALTLVAAGLDPRLRAQPQDLAVLFAYLALVTGAVTGAAAFVGALAAAAWARRGGREPGPALSRNVGLALALAGLGYLALWWRSHLLGAPWPTQLLAALLGLAASLAMGRFGTLAAVAVLSAGGSAHLPEAALSRRRLLPLVTAAAVLLGASVVAASYVGARAAAPPQDFAVVPTGLRVRVLGVDGLDPSLVGPMAARGELPHLAALLERGARLRLRVEPELVPAIVWTTIATGRGPADHGIQSAGGRRLAGMHTPVALGDEGRFARLLGTTGDLLRLTRAQPPSAVLRSVKAFWNVASEKGLRVGVVNWWATWPADSVNGYLVTDRAIVRLEKGGAADREVHPPEALDALRALAAAQSGEDRARRLDRFHWQAARALRGASPPDLEAVYLPGLDIVTMQQLGEAGSADLASLDARLAAVRDHYRFVDGLVGEAVASLGRDEMLLLLGDPGRRARRSQTEPAGLLVLAGAGVAAGDHGTASERDLAPTVLHLLGLPVSRELPGRVLEDSLTAEFRAAHPVRSVAAYGRRPPARPAESGLDAAVLEELRSLGYIR